MPRLGAHKYQEEAGQAVYKARIPTPAPLKAPGLFPNSLLFPRHLHGEAGEGETGQGVGTGGLCEPGAISNETGFGLQSNLRKGSSGPLVQAAGAGIP